MCGYELTFDKSASFPVFFVILVSQPLGRLLARVLPDYTVPLGRFSFTLNPGPFSVKEHAIIGIAANSGSQGQWASECLLGWNVANMNREILTSASVPANKCEPVLYAIPVANFLLLD